MKYSVRKIYIPLVGILLCGAVVPVPVIAQPPTRPPHSPEYQWTQESWDGNDSAYVRIRHNLEQTPQAALKTQLGGMQSSLIQRQSQAQPDSIKAHVGPQAVFRYGYTAYLLGVKFHNAGLDRQVWSALHGLQMQPSPGTYNYTRLHFLLAARQDPYAPLTDVGLRLAQKDAQDYDVRYYLVTMLHPGLAQKDKQLALSLCGQMLRIAPRRPDAYATLGWTYFRSWVTSHSAQDKQKSQAAYTRYLQLAPANDNLRPRAQQILKTLDAH